MRATLLLTLLAVGCDDSALDVPGAHWVGDRLSSRPAEPAPLEGGGADAAPEPAAKRGEAAASPAPDPDASRPELKLRAERDGGITLTERSTIARGDDLDTLLAHAEKMVADRRPEEALAAARRAVGLAPKDPRALTVQARAMSAAGNDEGALDSYAAALRESPADKEALYGLARSQAGVGRYRDALQTLERLRAVRGDDPRIDELRAFIATRTGDKATARSALERAASKRPDDPDSLITLGNTLANQGEYADAAEAFRKAAAKRPRDAKLQLQLGTALGLAGKREEAEQALTRATRLGNKAEAWKNLAAIREQLGDYAGAIGAWSRLRVLTPPPERPAIDRRIRELRGAIEAQDSAPKTP